MYYICALQTEKKTVYTCTHRYFDSFLFCMLDLKKQPVSEILMILKEMIISFSQWTLKKKV